MAANNKNTNGNGVIPFAIKDCALAAIAIGKRAQNLRELRDNLLTIHTGSIYYHFWGGLLRPRFDDPEYNNDFAGWARHGLHDTKLAERLGVIDPTEYDDIEDLRQELIDVIEERLDESEIVTWAKNDQQFHFIRSQIFVFDTHKKINTPEELAMAVPHMSISSIFYHFIDARRRTQNNVDDFEAWLAGFGEKHSDLYKKIAGIDPYFISLSELRHQLVTLFNSHFKIKQKGK
ncbi:DUF5752 family protein [Thermodesulfobacteriota bacterium]